MYLSTEEFHCTDVVAKSTSYATGLIDQTVDTDICTVSDYEQLLADKASDVVRLLPQPEKISAWLLSTQAVSLCVENSLSSHTMAPMVSAITVEHKNHVATYQASHLSLRVECGVWYLGCAVRQSCAGTDTYSVQFFDRFGRRILAVGLQGENASAQWEHLIEQFAGDEQGSEVMLLRAQPAEVVQRLSVVERSALQQAWANVNELPAFHDMLSQLRIRRLSALYAMHGIYSHMLENSAVARALAVAAYEHFPVQILVGSHGVMQTYRGHVAQISAKDGGIFIQGEGFELNLNETGLFSTWAVYRPMGNGQGIHCVEAYDQEGGLVIQVYGGAVGTGEPEIWRELILALAEESSGA